MPQQPEHALHNPTSVAAHIASLAAKVPVSGAEPECADRSRCCRKPKSRLQTYVSNYADIWQAKVRYKIKIDLTFAYTPLDINARVQQCVFPMLEHTQRYAHHQLIQAATATEKDFT